MKRYSAMLTYTEKDGFEIQHEGHRYRVCGYCDGEYFCYFNPNEPASANIVCIEFNAWIDNIWDENGEKVDITLTDDEFELFKQYMAPRLDEVAKNYDFPKNYFDVYDTEDLRI